MKKNSIKISTLSGQALARKEMAAIAGGERKICECACYYENNEGSSTAANADANYSSGVNSTKGCNRVIKADDRYGVIIQNHE